MLSCWSTVLMLQVASPAIRIIHGDHDRVTSHLTTIQFFDRISSKDKELEIYHGYEHVMNKVSSLLLNGPRIMALELALLLSGRHRRGRRRQATTGTQGLGRMARISSCWAGHFRGQLDCDGPMLVYLDRLD
jgi:hypothetical protein